LFINSIPAALQLLIVLVTTFSVDRFDRRALLLAGFSIQGSALLILFFTTAIPANGKIFCEVDAVEAGEERRDREKTAAMEMSTVEELELASKPCIASSNEGAARAV
jgi:hypothetical protein